MSSMHAVTHDNWAVHWLALCMKVDAGVVRRRHMSGPSVRDAVQSAHRQRTAERAADEYAAGCLVGHRR